MRVWLKFIEGSLEGETLEVAVLTDRHATVGRGAHCEVVLGEKDRTASSSHAKLWLKNEELYVTDIGSQYGLFVNEKATMKAKLRQSDRLRFGFKGPVAIVTFSDAADVAPSPELRRPVKKRRPVAMTTVRAVPTDLVEPKKEPQQVPTAPAASTPPPAAPHAPGGYGAPAATPPPGTPGWKSCPFCAEMIRDQAVKCRYCGEFLPAGTRPPAAGRPTAAPPPPPAPSVPPRLPGLPSPPAPVLPPPGAPRAGEARTERARPVPASEAKTTMMPTLYPGGPEIGKRDDAPAPAAPPTASETIDVGEHLEEGTVHLAPEGHDDGTVEVDAETAESAAKGGKTVAGIPSFLEDDEVGSSAALEPIEADPVAESAPPSGRTVTAIPSFLEGDDDDVDEQGDEGPIVVDAAEAGAAEGRTMSAIPAFLDDDDADHPGTEGKTVVVAAFVDVDDDDAPGPPAPPPSSSGSGRLRAQAPPGFARDPGDPQGAGASALPPDVTPPPGLAPAKRAPMPPGFDAVEGGDDAEVV